MCVVEIFRGTCFQARTYVVDALKKGAALLVCANAGRPCGKTNKDGKFVVSEEKLQEEEASCEIFKIKGRSFVENVLFRSWGLLGDGETMTHQGFDYTICPMSDYSLVLASFLAGDTHYIFVVAPNAGTAGHVGGSMRRTASTAVRAPENYLVFREGVKFAVIGFLIACIGLDAVPIVTMIGCGIYAGVHKIRINEEFHTIVEEVLRMLYNGVPIGSNFGLVLVPEGKDAKTSNDRTTCEYGSKCTRKNPDHIAQYHSVSNARPALPQARPAGVSEESSVCVYGSNCTRMNPDHIMRCHTAAAPMQPTVQRAPNMSVCAHGKECYRTNQAHVNEYHQGRTPASRGIVRASTVARCPYGDSC